MSSWSDAEIVFVQAIACPYCQALRPIVVRSSPIESDGSRTRRCICRRCSRRFVVVVEPPEGTLPSFGNCVFPPGTM